MKKLIDEKDEMYAEMYKMDDQVLAQKVIFIVDDSADSLQLMESLVRRNLPCQLQCFTNEFEALKKMSEIRPSLLILDVMLASLNGMKIGKAVSDLNFYDGPIVFTSANESYEKEISILFNDECIFLPKPINRNDFIRAILMCLHKNQH